MLTGAVISLVQEALEHCGPDSKATFKITDAVSARLQEECRRHLYVSILLQKAPAKILMVLSPLSFPRSQLLSHLNLTRRSRLQEQL